MSGLAIEAQHRLRQPSLQQCHGKLASAAANIHNVAQRFVGGQRQNRPMYRVKA
jgi:hypothetical protein